MSIRGLCLTNVPSNEGFSNVDFLGVIASPGPHLPSPSFPSPFLFRLLLSPEVHSVCQLEPSSGEVWAANACDAVLQSASAIAVSEGTCEAV